MMERKLLRPLYILVSLALLLSAAAWPQQAWSTRLADSAMARWPDGHMTRGQEKSAIGPTTKVCCWLDWRNYPKQRRIRNIWTTSGDRWIRWLQRKAKFHPTRST